MRATRVTVIVKIFLTWLAVRFVRKGILKGRHNIVHGMLLGKLREWDVPPYMRSPEQMLEDLQMAIDELKKEFANYQEEEGY